jgi:hypothetical protein
MKNDACKQAFKLFTPLLTAAAITGAIWVPSIASETNNKPAMLDGQKAYNQAIAEIGKGDAWKDPERVIPEVRFDGVPITDVGEMLRDQFNNDFDILLPSGQKEGWDWTTMPITLRLKSVKASEIFNAMNLVFAGARTPLHWELTMNGHRSTALLRVLTDQKPTIDPATGLPLAPAKTPNEKPMVLFVGDLFGDERPGQVTPAILLQTITEVCKMRVDKFSYHSGGELLVVRGSDEDFAFVKDTLAALRQKVRFDAERKAEGNTAEMKPKSNATKAP